MILVSHWSERKKRKLDNSTLSPLSPARIRFGHGNFLWLFSCCLDAMCYYSTWNIYVFFK